MGFNHIWFSCILDDDDYNKLLPHFEEAKSLAVLSNESKSAIKYWKEHPEKFELNHVLNSTDPSIGKRINDFLWSFNLPGFEQLAESLCSQNGIWRNFLIEEKKVRFISTSRNTPVSILWYGLGLEKANRLPGKMGNLLIHSSAIEEILNSTRLVYDELNLEEFTKKGASYSGGEVSTQDMTAIFTMLPDSLNEALEEKKNVLFIARKQL